ncbi:MAG: hypothetical protein ACRES7_02350 [Gammaproteobacteria bacterium]
MRFQTRRYLTYAFVGIVAFCCSTVALYAAADVLKAVQWQALFDQVPAPPASLAQAGASVVAARNKSNNAYLALTYPTLLRSHTDLQAGLNAMNQAAAKPAAATLGIDAGRMQSDPAYAQQMQQRMATMTQAEKVQMAMQMAAAQQQAMQTQMSNPAGLRAGGNLTSYVVGEGDQQLGAIEADLRKNLDKIVADYDGRHAALDKQLLTLLKACPQIKECGDTTDCAPVPSCVVGINARVPALIAQHRQLAAAELTSERALFTKIRAELQPVIAKTATLTETAEKAGTSASQLQTGYMAIANGAGQLQAFAAMTTLRAGFWQGIKQVPIPDDFGVYLTAGPVGYQYPLGQDNLTAPPADLPDGW